MKKFKYIMLCALPALLLASCSDEKPGSWEGKDALNFVQTGANETAIAADTIVRYSFVFEPEEVKTHTIWIEVETMGRKAGVARPVTLRAATPYGDEARAGDHYVPFNDAETAPRYVIPAGETTARLPVILKREKLGGKEYELRIVFEANDHFSLGYEKYSHRTIIVSDILSKPSNWDNTRIEEYFGTYSPEKHQFMYDVTGLNIDYDYFQRMLDNNDTAEMGYYRDWYEQKLEDENARRELAGEPLLDFSFYE